MVQVTMSSKVDTTRTNCVHARILRMLAECLLTTDSIRALDETKQDQEFSNPATVNDEVFLLINRVR